MWQVGAVCIRGVRGKSVTFTSVTSNGVVGRHYLRLPWICVQQRNTMAETRKRRASSRVAAAKISEQLKTEETQGKRRKASKNEESKVVKQGAKHTEKQTEQKTKRNSSSAESTTIDTEGDNARPRYWLFKSEPSEYSIDKFEKEGVADWDGVRNPTASKFMREVMKIGDKAFFYHSNCKEPGLVGLATIVKEGYPDETAWDVNDPHFDPRSLPERPRWHKVDLRFDRKLERLVGLREMKTYPELSQMVLFRQSRLSVQPLEEQEWAFLLQKAKEEPPAGFKGQAEHFSGPAGTAA